MASKKIKDMPKNTVSSSVDEAVKISNPLEEDREYISSAHKAPCDVDDDAFIPYWEKVNGEVVYGVDKYTVSLVAGCGDVWICRVKNEDNLISDILEPNIDVFFSQKEADRKLNGIKKTEDIKKLSKWKRRALENVQKN